MPNGLCSRQATGNQFYFTVSAWGRKPPALFVRAGRLAEEEAKAKPERNKGVPVGTH
jgi:hypothetical protein